MTASTLARAVPPGMMRLAEDTRLVELARSGSGAAFDELFRRHHGAVHAAAYHILGDRDAADDVVQDVFIRVHGALPTFRGEASVRTWVMRIAVNRSISYQRWAARRRSPGLTEAGGTRNARASEGADGALREALGSLRPVERALIVLRDVRGHSYEEIGDMLGCSAGSVGVRLHRARTRLRREYSKLTEEAEAP